MTRESPRSRARSRAPATAAAAVGDQPHGVPGLAGAGHGGAGDDGERPRVLDPALPAQPVADAALHEIAEQPGESRRAADGGTDLGVVLQQGVQQMGGVDLPVPVPHGPAAGTGDHRCQLGAEHGIVVQVRHRLVMGGRAGCTGLHSPYPISLGGPGHPRAEPSSRPTQSGHRRSASHPYGGDQTDPGRTARVGPVRRGGDTAGGLTPPGRPASRRALRPRPTGRVAHGRGDGRRERAVRKPDSARRPAPVRRRRPARCRAGRPVCRTGLSARRRGSGTASCGRR